MSAALALIEEHEHILFLQRSRQTSRPGQWCLPGGRINALESPEQACVREVQEEAGIRVQVLKTVLKTTHSYYFMCRRLGAESVRLSPRESSDFAWVHPSQLLDLGYIMDFRTVVPLLKRLGYAVPWP